MIIQNKLVFVYSSERIFNRESRITMKLHTDEHRHVTMICVKFQVSIYNTMAAVL